VRAPRRRHRAVFTSTALAGALAIGALALAGCVGGPRGSAVGASSAGPAAPLRASPARFDCTRVLGVSTTGDWFKAGFEALVEDGRWEAVTRKGAFVDQWGDPTSPPWVEPVVSPCVGGVRPDRVLLTAVHWGYTTAAEWEEALTRAVSVIRAKHSTVRRIELLTMLRGPGNRSCGNPRTVVAPYIDEAIEGVVRRFPGLVVAGPRFELPTCAPFVDGGPHFTKAGMTEVARVIAAHYAAQ
jgi:hypothetical protein